MCTAITYQTKDFYFGRTLDYDISFEEEVVITPRNYPFSFLEMDCLSSHYAIIGMAHVAQAYPLYFDAVNEKGLAMAGLNFLGNAHYRKSIPGADNVASFELVPWILGQCATVKEAEILLSRLNLTDAAFSDELSPTDLHWLLADRKGGLVLEPNRGGLRIYDNPAGVLTNNPPFPQQLENLNNYMHLSPEEPKNRFSQALDLKPYSRGMGALGLPGDLSSQSRFVRAAFTRWNSISGDTELESVGQFFHILETVSQTNGCCRLENGNCEKTLYTSCCNANQGIYYYTTYENRRIIGIRMHGENLDGENLIRYPLVRQEQIRMENA